MPWRKASVLLVWAVLVPAAVVFVPYEVMTAATAGMTDSAEFGSRANPFADLGLSLVALVAGGIYVFASLAATTFVTIFVVEHIRARFLGYQPSARDTWAMIRRVVWRYLGYLVLLTIALIFVIFILALIGGVVIGIAFAASPNSAAGPTVLLFASILVLLLTALATWPLVKLSMVPAIMVFEGATATTAMSRSWQLTKGRAWRTFGALLTVSIAFGLVSTVITLFAAGIPSGYLSDYSMSALDSFASTSTFSLATVLADLVTFPLTMLSTLGVTIAATLIYLDARTQTERLDLTVEHWHHYRGQGYQPQQLAYPFAAPVAAPPAPPAPPAPSTPPAAGPQSPFPGQP
jgi:hypothetical protein